MAVPQPKMTAEAAVQLPAAGQEPGPSGARLRRIAWVILAAALVAAFALDPAWLLRVLALPLWLGGFWRVALIPSTLVLLASLTLANTSAPGAAWEVLRRAASAFWRKLPLALAVLVAAGSFVLAAGAVTAGHVARSLAIFGLQLLLVPETPPTLALLAAAAGVLALDARRAALLGWLRERWHPFVAPLVAWLKLVLPVAAAALVAGFIAATLFPQAMRGWTTPDPPDAQAYDLYRTFFNYSVPDDPQIEQRTGFGLGLRGLTLPPGSSGAVVIRANRPPQSVVLLKADFYNRPLTADGASLTPETFGNTLELAAGDGAAYRTILRDVSLGQILGGQVLDLTPLLGDARVYRLRFTAQNTTAGEVTVLPAVVLSTVTNPETTPHATFPVVAYAVAAAGAVCALLWRRTRPLVAFASGSVAGTLVALVALAAAAAAPAGSPRTVSPGAAVASDVASLLFDPSPAYAETYAVRGASLVLLALALASVALALVQSLRSRRQGAVGTAGGAWQGWLLAACLAVSAIAVDVRWEELIRVRYEFLLPDALGYKAIAAEFPSKMASYRIGRQSDLLTAAFESGYDARASVPAVFYGAENNGREPGWPGVLRLFFNVLGVSAFHSRLASLALSALTAALTCWLGWRAIHPLAGVTGGLFYAFNRAQIVNSVAGLREEIVGLVFLVLIGAIFAGTHRSDPGKTAWWRLALAALSAAWLILVRGDMLVLAGTVVTLGALALRWPWRTWLVTSCVVGTLAAPMYLGFAFTRLDAFYPGTYGATVNRNLEFPERMGTPGFPTPEEYATNWAAGPAISPMTYFLGYHTIPQFLTYMVRGFVRIFPEILFRDQPLALWLCVAGGALLLVSRRWLMPFAIVVGLVPFYAFLAGVPNPWVFAPRYAHHVLPYAALAAGFGVWAVPLWLARAARARGRAQSA